VGPDPLPVWVCGHGFPVRGFFFGCGFASLVVCLGLFGDLSLFCQNKFGDMSPCGWMLQKTSFTDGSHGRDSQS
jgi:hypothetical protein